MIPYELRTTSTVRPALSGTLPESVAAAAYKFITGPLLADPHRIGKSCSRRWTTGSAPAVTPTG
jgi:hypothetical protein